MGNPALPPPKGGTAPQFSAHVYCGQTAEWIKMPLGMELGCGRGHIVLSGDPAPPKRGTAPNFRPMSIAAKWSPSQLLLSTFVSVPHIKTFHTFFNIIPPHCHHHCLSNFNYRASQGKLVQNFCYQMPFLVETRQNHRSHSP